MKIIDIVVPCYNESENIIAFYRQVRKVFTEKLSNYDYLFIFVNDGSSDNSLNILKQLAAEDERVKYLSFSRNFGHQLAVKAGLTLLLAMLLSHLTLICNIHLRLYLNW